MTLIGSLLFLRQCHFKLRLASKDVVQMEMRIFLAFCCVVVVVGWTQRQAKSHGCCCVEARNWSVVARGGGLEGNAAFTKND